ncbi:2531_t:CDS:2 [Racocetra persica]|uniref:2531_t:CDS:1 n=1 Tax=Racocetra persica TaxID=160502 RepID=A0ACA9KTT1_9GLOM|nr:2531_t:CDS:2 [Racocetra persica]
MNNDKKLSNLPYANVQRMPSSRTATAAMISSTKSSEAASKASTLRIINQEEIRSLFEQRKGSQYFIPEGYEPILIPRDSQLQPVATLLQNNKGLQQRSLQKQQLKIQQANNQNSAAPGVVVVNKTLTQLVSPINCNINPTPPDVRFPHLVLAQESNQIQYSVNSCSPSTSPNEYVRIESSTSFDIMMDGVSPDSESDATSFGFFDYGYQSHPGESFGYLQQFNVNPFDFSAMIPSTSHIDS